MTETKKKLSELENRLRKIKQKLRALPQKREELESIYNELKEQWPEQLGKWSIGELDEAELEQYRQKLALSDRNLKELGELEKGLIQLERAVLAQMKPLQKKIRLEKTKAQYQVLKARLQAGNYDRGEICTFRQIAHELSYDKEASELLRRIEHVRNREMKFSEVYGLRPEGVNDAV